jgi:hypothetical protein
MLGTLFLVGEAAPDTSSPTLSLVATPTNSNEQTIPTASSLVLPIPQ